MTKFIEVTNRTGQGKISISFREIRFFSQLLQGGTFIDTGEDRSFEVKETYEEVKKLIDKAEESE